MANDWDSSKRPADQPPPAGGSEPGAWWRETQSAPPPPPPLTPSSNWPPPQPAARDPLRPPPPAYGGYAPAPPPQQPLAEPPVQVAAARPLPPGGLVMAGKAYGPAGFGARLKAFLLDWIILAVLFGIVSGVVDMPPPDVGREMKLLSKQVETALRGQLPDARLSDELQDLLRPQSFLGWLNVALCGCYFILFQGLAGATLGKLACGLTVLRHDGQPLGLGRAALRYLGYFVLAKAFYGTFTMPFDPERRAAHDFLAGSNVFRELRWR